jgi:hypothetical protein
MHVFSCSWSTFCKRILELKLNLPFEVRYTPKPRRGAVFTWTWLRFFSSRARRWDGLNNYYISPARKQKKNFSYLSVSSTALHFRHRDKLVSEVGTESVIAITLRYVFALSLLASTLGRKVIASYSYRLGFIEIVNASCIRHCDLIGIIISSYSYRSNVIK